MSETTDPTAGEHSAESDAIISMLTAARTRRNLSMREVARAAGVSPSCVHSWEHGARNPSLDNLRAWAASLGYDLILTRRSETPNESPMTPEGTQFARAVVKIKAGSEDAYGSVALTQEECKAMIAGLQILREE